MNRRNLTKRPGFDDWDEDWQASLANQHLGVNGRTLAEQLAGLVQGDTRELLLFPRVPALRSGAARLVSKAYLTLKDKQADSDPTENAAFNSDGGRLGISTTNVAGRGQILSASVPEIRFDLTAANTAALTARRVYYVDCQIVMDDGALYTVERCTVEPLRGVTLATS